MKPAISHHITSHIDDNQLNGFLVKGGRHGGWKKKKNQEAILLFFSMGLSRIVSTLESMWLLKFMKPTLVTSRRPTPCFFLVKGRHGGWLKERRIRKCFYFSFNGTQLLSILRVIVVVHLAPVPRRSARERCHSTLAARDLAERHRYRPTGRHSWTQAHRPVFQPPEGTRDTHLPVTRTTSCCCCGCGANSQRAPRSTSYATKCASPTTPQNSPLAPPCVDSRAPSKRAACSAVSKVSNGGTRVR